MLRNQQKQDTRAGGEVSVGVGLEGSLKAEHSRLECQLPRRPLWVRRRVRPGLAHCGGRSPVLADWGRKDR